MHLRGDVIIITELKKLITWRCIMKTYFGVDYHKKYNHGTIMSEKGKILKQGRFLNHRESINKFLDGYGGDNCLSVLEATRNRSDPLKARYI